MTGVYYVLVTSGVMLVFEVLLVVVGVYVVKNGISYEQPEIASIVPPLAS
jgi:hypothetical protein